MAVIKLKVNAMICFLFYLIRGGVEAKIQIKVHCKKKLMDLCCQINILNTSKITGE